MRSREIANRKFIVKINKNIAAQWLFKCFF